jgi:flavin reductase (DIM6/NTAB) family NADH-FMN oxidoreductase RutF
MQADIVAKLFASLDRELWLVTARAGARRGGLIATFVQQASIVPDMPRVFLGIAKQHHTWELIETSGAFALHMLGEEQIERVWHFGLCSGRDFDKLADQEFSEGITGSPILAGALAALECRVEARFDSGDRTIFLAEVVDAIAHEAECPLTFHRMLELAPAEKRQALRDQMRHDSGIDAAAIRAWRAHHQPHS